jgi:hypothetical protein
LTSTPKPPSITSIALQKITTTQLILQYRHLPFMRPPLLDLLIDHEALAEYGGTVSITQLRGLFVLAFAENPHLRDKARESLRWSVVYVLLEKSALTKYDLLHMKQARSLSIRSKTTLHPQSSRRRECRGRDDASLCPPSRPNFSKRRNVLGRL